MANQRREFDPERVVVVGKSGRKLTYETPNGVWYVQATLLKRPGGMFVDGEVWCTHKYKHGDRSTRQSWWSYGNMTNDTDMIWNSPRMPPTYVKYIAEELGVILHKKFPLCGTQFANLQEDTMSYWEQYGKQSPSFWKGVKTGIEAYAWWKDGQGNVGTTGMTLRQAHAEVDEHIRDGSNVYDPISKAAVTFLEEAGVLSDDPEEAKADADRIVRFVEDNALAIMNTYAEVLLDES